MEDKHENNLKQSSLMPSLMLAASVQLTFIQHFSLVTDGVKDCLKSLATHHYKAMNLSCIQHIHGGRPTKDAKGRRSNFVFV